MHVKETFFQIDVSPFFLPEQMDDKEFAFWNLNLCDGCQGINLDKDFRKSRSSNGAKVDRQDSRLKSQTEAIFGLDNLPLLKAAAAAECSRRKDLRRFLARVAWCEGVTTPLLSNLSYSDSPHPSLSPSV